MNLDELDYYNDKYAALSNLLINFLEDTYYPERNDIDTIKRSANKWDAEYILQALKEGRELLQLQPFPWEWVSGVANGLACNPGEEKLYTNEQLAIRWVRWMMEALEAEAKRAGKL